MPHHHRVTPAGSAWRALPVLCALLVTAPTLAQDSAFPNRPIKVIVPYAPGGGTDTSARLFADKTGKLLKQTLVVENKPGAGGQIAAVFVKQSEPDGYTLLWGGSTQSVVTPLLEKNITYDPVKDFTTVGLGTTYDLVLVVPASSPVRSLQQLITDMKTPGKYVTYGSSGVATPVHIAAAALSSLAGGNAQPVQYKGSGPALQDLLAGRLSFSFDTVAGVVQHIRTGKLVPLTALTQTRIKALPDVPTAVEAGMPSMMQFRWQFWQALQAPSRTPRPVVQKLNEAMRQVSTDPDLLAKLDTLGLHLMPQLTPQEADDLVQKDIAAFKALMTKVDLKEAR